MAGEINPETCGKGDKVLTMFEVSFSVEVQDFEAWRVELADWFETCGASDYRVYSGDGSYSEDGSVSSVFLDYATKDQADVSRAKLQETWPFRNASLVDNTALVCQAAASDTPSGP